MFSGELSHYWSQSCVRLSWCDEDEFNQGDSASYIRFYIGRVEGENFERDSRAVVSFFVNHKISSIESVLVGRALN